MTYPQYPYGYPPRPPKKQSHILPVIIGLLIGIPVFLIIVLIGTVMLVGMIGMNASDGDTTPTRLPTGSYSPNRPSSSPGDDATDLFDDDDNGRDTTKETTKPIGNCNDTDGYKNYSKTALDMYNKYNALLNNGTILQQANLPKNQDSLDYVHDFMVVLTDYKASLYFGCYTDSTDLDEVNDKYDAKALEIQDYERKFLAHQDLGVTIKITGRDGRTYESDGKAPAKVTASDLETKIKAVPMKPGVDGTWIDTGDAMVHAMGLTANYDYQQIGQYCKRSYGDTSTVQAAYCSASPTVVYVNEKHPGFNKYVQSSYWTDVIKHELAHAIIDRQCGTTSPAIGASGEALANSYAVKYLGANKTNLQDNIKDYPEYTITTASDKGADAVHNGSCSA